MKLSHKQKKYLRKNLGKKPLTEIVEEREVPVGLLESYLKQRGKVGLLRELRDVRLSGKGRKTTIATPGDIKNHFRKYLYIFLLLLALCLVVYLRVLNGEFVSDDLATIVSNEYLGNLWLDLKQANGFQVLKSLIFLIFGRSVVAYHSFNLLSHILTTWAAYFFLYIVTARRKIAILASFLFAVHPVNSEVVCWISAGHYAFSAFLFFVSFILYHFYLENRGRLDYLVGAVLGYALALFLNIWILSLLPVYFLYEWFLRRERPNWSFYATLIMICILYLFYLGGHVTSRVSSALGPTGIDLVDSVTAAPLVILKDLYLLVWPINLAHFHEGYILTPLYLLLSLVAASIFLLALPLIFRKSRIFIFYFLFFLVSISISLSPIKVTSGVAERYLYLGSLVFCLSISYLLLWLEKEVRIENLATILFIALLTFYSVRTYLRSQDWWSRESLWQKEVETNPRSWRAHNSLGTAYEAQRDWDKAIEEYRKSIELAGEYTHPLYNLANTYLQMGDLESAEKYFREVLEREPSNYQALYSLGVVNITWGRVEEARRYWKEALNVNPDYKLARQALGTLEDRD